MNAPNALSQDKITAERKAYEPSMEEILASIRRIIADDQALPPRPAPEQAAPAPMAASAVEPPVAAEPVAPPPPERDEAEIDGWTDVPAAIPPRPSRPAAAPEAAAPPRSGFDFVPGRDFRPLPPRAPVVERSAFTREPAAPRLVQEPPAERHEAARRIVSSPRPQPPAPAVAEEALVSPATDAMVSHAFNTLIASRFLQSNDVMSEMVREMLRPMLKAWLDDNLPILVERLVRAEIERVARGGR
jgi:cell pole-organizing protein PopZ